MAHYSGYSEDEILPIAEMMFDYLKNQPDKCESLCRKYCGRKYMKASCFAKDFVAGHNSVASARDKLLRDDDLSDENEEEYM